LSKDEDYNDDVDELIDPKNKEILVCKNTFETNQNNLNEIYIKTNQPKFYTCPDEAITCKRDNANYYVSTHSDITTNSQFPIIPDKREDPE
jgi:hypothetical protein